MSRIALFHPTTPPHSYGSHVKCAKVSVKAREEERELSCPDKHVVQQCFMDVGRPRWDGISAGGGEARPFKSPPQSLGQVGQMEVVHLIHYTESDVSLTLAGLVCTQAFLFLMQR